MYKNKFVRNNFVRLNQIKSNYSLTPSISIKVLSSDPIDPICKEIFKSNGHILVEKPNIKKEELMKILSDYECLIIRSRTKVDKDIISAGVNLKYIGRAGSGCDNIDIHSATSNGILVVNTPGANTVSTAEITCAHILNLAANIPQACEALKQGRWEKFPSMIDLHGKKIGLIGFGKIGIEVSRLCKSLGMTIYAFDPILTNNGAKKLQIECVSLDFLIENSDFISIHSILTRDTKHLLNKNNLNKCKKGVKIINCARGGIINEDDLLNYLNNHHIDGIGLDTLEVEPPIINSSSDLLMHKKSIITPHIGANTVEAQQLVAKDIATNICNLINGNSFNGVVNFPDYTELSASPFAIPYILLAEKIGSVQAQLLEGYKMEKILINLKGSDITKGVIVDLLKRAVLKGLLSELSADQNLSYVNSIQFAEKMGLSIAVNFSDFVQSNDETGYTNSISIQVEMLENINDTKSIDLNNMNNINIDNLMLDENKIYNNHSIIINNEIDESDVIEIFKDKDSHVILNDSIIMKNEKEINKLVKKISSIEGIVLGNNELRLINIDGYKLSTPLLSGNKMILFNNNDNPGVLDQIIDIFIHHDISLKHFAMGRQIKSKLALGVIIVDKFVSDDVMTELNRIKDIISVKPINLKNEIDPINLALINNGIIDETCSNINSCQTSSILNEFSNNAKKPLLKPQNNQFSSGPTRKHSGYELSLLNQVSLGRSHRSDLCKARIKKAIDETRSILNIPKDYLIGLIPGSDTGAFEAAMWNMCGERTIDICYWEAFGKGWKEDIINHLNIKNVREFTASYGYLPNLNETNPNHDIIFTFNGTTSGVKVPSLNWISSERTGLTFNDATSAAFAMNIDWLKCDVTTFSWQKVLGGEAGIGMLILSPRAVERLNSYHPKNRPIPKIFRIKNTDAKGNMKLDLSIFNGDTINTPSLLVIEDYIESLNWAQAKGGLDYLISKSNENLKVIEKYVEKNADWIQFLVDNKSIRSNTSVCLIFDKLNKFQVKSLINLLENECVAYDISSYRDAPYGIRIWCGSTVEKDDLILLLPWIKWAYKLVISTSTENGDIEYD